MVSYVVCRGVFSAFNAGALLQGHDSVILCSTELLPWWILPLKNDCHDYLAFVTSFVLLYDIYIV